jgi:hypothetical protein
VEARVELQSAFVEFGRLLDERLSLGVLTTEDTIRYTLYFALTSSAGLKHTDLTLEYPHPTMPGAKVDTVISAAAGRESMAFEFKYDRANPGGSNQNRTQRAAKALIDLFRLVKLPDVVAAARYFVYVTDAEMAGYFRNPANRLHDLFELAEGAEHVLGPARFEGFSRTLMTMVEPMASTCVITRVFTADLPASHCIRIFKVSTPPAGTIGQALR